ncbi:MAG: alpha/beta fold hydrolase [Flavobacteriales bacterium]|nr:alpha/beta fold hydrolase [Flavobacteriales bacterium]
MKSTVDQIIGEISGKEVIMDSWLQDTPSPSLVLIHGFKGFKDWGHWNQLAEFFSQRGYNFFKFNLSHNGGTADQVIDFPDLEAFGMNNFDLEAKNVSMVLDYLSSKGLADRIALIGHSRGGSISILSALEDDRVKALVTLNAVTDIPLWMERYDTIEWRKQGVIHIPNARTGQQMPMYVQFLEDFERQRTRYDILRRASELTVPTLIIHCEDDRVVEVDQARRLNELLSDSHLLLIPHGGHTLGSRYPVKSEMLPAALHQAAEAINGFIRSIDW